MSADCCFKCTNTLNLGCVPPCGTIETDITAEKTGEYKFIFGYLGQQIIKRKPFVEGDKITIDPDGLNETFSFRFIIKDPDEDQVSTTVDSVVYDCFEITTKIEIPL